MDLPTITEDLLASNCTEKSSLREIASKIQSKIKQNEIKIVDLVKSLDPILTNCDHQFRFKGVYLLSEVIRSLDTSFLSTKEIEVLCEFVCLRLLDHKTMEEPALRTLKYFIVCRNKPSGYNATLLELLKTKTNVQKMHPNNRGLVYEIIGKIMDEKLIESNSIDGDFLYSFIHIIEGESNPKNMLTCFNLVARVMRNFKDLEPYIDDLFEWLSSYYPIDYTPDTKEENQSIAVTRDYLVTALDECFFANELNAANLQTLLLEKLEATSVSTKIESLNCLIKCYEVFPAESIKDYATSLWTVIRTECLRKTSLVDRSLLQTSYKALYSLSQKLSTLREFYFMFICDLYEELSIAFRKPEMELFDPAMRLIISVSRPSVLGYNYILSKVIPIAINAIKSNEYRPLESLAFVFESIDENHPNPKLSDELNSTVSDLVVALIDSPGIPDIDSSRLLKSIITCKLSLERPIIDRLVDKLKDSKRNITVMDEECLALICLNYSRSDIICDRSDIDHSLISLLKLIYLYKSKTSEHLEDGQHLIKFKIYLRILLYQLDGASQNELTKLDLEVVDIFLDSARDILKATPIHDDLIELVAKLHGIMLNKMNDQQVEKLVLAFFGSDFCQKLMLQSQQDVNISCSLYIPVIKWCFKSLIMRNDKLSTPMINLILNFVVSEKNNVDKALTGAKVFCFALSDDRLFEMKRGYRIFTLFKQKLYVLLSKEIRIRYGQDDRTIEERYLLLATLASILPLVPQTVYKRDFDWLLREILKCLNNLKNSIDKSHHGIIDALFQSLITIVSTDQTGNLAGLIESLINLSLDYIVDSDKLTIRALALDCLAKIPSIFKESELLSSRQTVIRRLKSSLGDKKRVVRRKAAEARLRWVLVGQPIG